jgi:hypothetical protein
LEKLKFLCYKLHFYTNNISEFLENYQNKPLLRFPSFSRDGECERKTEQIWKAEDTNKALKTFPEGIVFVQITSLGSSGT